MTDESSIDKQIVNSDVQQERGDETKFLLREDRDWQDLSLKHNPLTPAERTRLMTPDPTTTRTMYPNQASGDVSQNGDSLLTKPNESTIQLPDGEVSTLAPDIRSAPTVVPGDIVDQTEEKSNF